MAAKIVGRANPEGRFRRSILNTHGQMRLCFPRDPITIVTTLIDFILGTEQLVLDEEEWKSLMRTITIRDGNIIYFFSFLLIPSHSFISPLDYWIIGLFFIFIFIIYSIIGLESSRLVPF